MRVSSKVWIHYLSRGAAGLARKHSQTLASALACSAFTGPDAWTVLPRTVKMTP